MAGGGGKCITYLGYPSLAAGAVPADISCAVFYLVGAAALASPFVPHSESCAACNFNVETGYTRA